MKGFPPLVLFSLSSFWLEYYFLMQASNEDAKSVEISKLQKKLESLILELDAAKLATINEFNKNAVLQNQLELSVKEKSALEREIISIAELKKENAYLKVSYVSFSYLFSFPSRF